MKRILEIVAPLIWVGLAIYNFLAGIPSLGIGFMVLYYLDRQETKH